MNHVEKIALHFSGENEYFFRSLYSNWESLWVDGLKKSTDRILTKYDDAAHTIELDTLELELSPILEEDFEHGFLPEYEELLEQALLKQLYGNAHKSLRKTPTQERLSELLFQFLLHGSLPWNIDTIYKDINLLFLEVAQNETSALRHFFRTYGHYTGLQQRLVFQLDDEALKEGIRTIASGDSHFIISYVLFVQSKHKQIHTPRISRTPYHKVVWQIVYAYLLTDRSSFFDKKSFLRQTIRQLAIRHDIPYTKLLFLLLLKPEHRSHYPMELQLLLNTLKKEEEYSTVSRSGSWLKLYQIIKSEASGKTRFQNTEQKRILLSVLKHEDSNYRFLQLLKEPEILSLVEWVIPQHHRFVKTYTKTLDRHKEKGILQGKAGSEFRLVKWQIIFPVLLNNSGTGFNRRHFVLHVLQKVVARYNLKVNEILHYLHVQKFSFETDKELTAIFGELHERFTDTRETKETSLSIDAAQIATALRTLQNVSEGTYRQWKHFLTEETGRNNLLRSLSETEHRQLVRVLYLHDSPFILSYADVIERQKNTGLLQGKISGNFRSIKWQFIHAVLLEPQHQVFNKKHFVEKVIRKIAAHHNLKTRELLAYLYHETVKKEFGLPFELFNILEELYTESHKKERQKTISETTKPSEKKQTEEAKARLRLIRHFGNDKHLTALIDALAKQSDFVLYLAPVLQTEVGLRQFLLAEWNVAVSRKQVLIWLLRISKSYKGKSRSDILLKVIIHMFDELKSDEQRHEFDRYLQQASQKNELLRETLKIITEQQKETDMTGEIEQILPQPVEPELSFIGNAGLILPAPFLPRLFSMLQLTENGKFKDRDAQIRAMFLMQYAVFGTAEFPEHELPLNKLLTGFKTGIPVPRSVILTEEEIKTTDNMLQGIIQHWNKVKTIAGLREGFLQRDGKLEEREEQFELTVESKTYDLLLDNIPWNFRTTKFSWMEKAIQVKWR